MFLAGLLCLGNAAPDRDAPPSAPSEIAGIYNGSSFETCMAMELRDDGMIHPATKPASVPAEFRFVGLTERVAAVDEPADEDGFSSPRVPEIVQVKVTRQGGKPFTHADTRTECANGAAIDGFVAGSAAYDEVDSPPLCDRPIAVTVELPSYDVTSPRLDLAAIGWTPDKALLVASFPSDIGVFDLTGMQGRLVDGVLEMDGPPGRAKFRKLPGAKALPE